MFSTEEPRVTRRRGTTRKKNRPSESQQGLITPEAVVRLREQGLLSRVVRLPYPPSASEARFPPAPAAAPAPAPAPSPPSALTPQAARVASPADQPPSDDLNTTLLRPRHLDLELPGGERVQVERRPIVIGRRSADPTRASSAGATPPPGQPHEGVTLVAIDDPARSMSRQHLRVTTRADGSVWAEDLGSGNGTLLERGGDSVAALAPSVPVRIVSRDVLVLGDHRVRVVRRPPGASPSTSAGQPRGGAD
jgi:hypothetical protein